MRQQSWRASRYNFHVPTTSASLLYNARTNSLIRLRSDDGRALATLLSSVPSPFVDLPSFPESVASDLVDGGFIVRHDDDELASIQQLYWNARRSAPIVVTIAVTHDCNLGCFYCYEERSRDKLEASDIDTLLARLEESLAKSDRRDVHIDWYGGEPMLNVDFIENASQRLQSFCRARSVRYSASMISNGTRWPDDPVDFVTRHRIREVQISFDGDREHHDKYRRSRSATTDSSFDQAVRVVDSLHRYCKVAIRLNLDRNTAESALTFISFARHRGWLSGESLAVIQPARLAAFSSRSQFMEKWQFDVTEFESLKRRIKDAVSEPGRVQESETVDGFPRPRSSVCAALAQASFVLGADGREYRCGLQVGEVGRDAGAPAITSSSKRRLPTVSPDHDFWVSFDPTERARCGRCSFLPLCWSGCPKQHLEGNHAAIDEPLGLGRVLDRDRRLPDRRLRPSRHARGRPPGRRPDQL